MNKVFLKKKFDNEGCLEYIFNKNTRKQIQANILSLLFQYFPNYFYCGIFILEMLNAYHFAENLNHSDP